MFDDFPPSLHACSRFSAHHHGLQGSPERFYFIPITMAAQHLVTKQHRVNPMKAKHLATLHLFDESISVLGCSSLVQYIFTESHHTYIKYALTSEYNRLV